jgi:hypothetical protein
MNHLVAPCVLLACFAVSVQPQQSTPVVLTWDEANGGQHLFLNGQKFKILTGNGFTVTVGLRGNAKYLRVDVSVLNNSTASVDILPATFSVDELDPKEKTLAYVDPEKIIRSAQKKAAWGNALTAMGASMQRQQTTTTTNSMGTVNANASDGSFATGTYSGTSTSTTSAPDYAAQARASEAIRERNAQIASLSERLSENALKANTIAPTQSIGGFAVFASEKKVQKVLVSIPIAGTVFKFPFTFLGR